MGDMMLTIDLLIEKALLVVTNAGISAATIETSYKAPFRRIQLFSEKSSEQFAVDVLEEYLTYIEHPLRKEACTKAYYNLNRHAALLLLDCVHEEEPVWRQYRKDRSRYTPSSEFIELTELVISSMGTISDSHAVRTRRYLRQFFCYMEQCGIDNCGSMDSECIRAFLIDVASTQPKEAEYIVSSLRILLGFLSASDIVHISLDPAIYKPPVKGSSIICPFTKEEVKAILDAIDTTTVSGKRNKAIILLAITTGLRGCDIASLHFENIDWTKEELCVVQGKTTAPISIPLVPAAGNALVDYILNGRPESNEPNVFLSLKTPYRPITSSSSFSTLLNELCAKAGVKKIELRSFHSLRRSAGTWMAQAEVPVEMIAQVLGHASIRSSMPYIAFSPTTLDVCALDFADVPLVKGGVYAQH